MIIALSGFMGCGKSSVATFLAKRLGCRWLDLDRIVEQGEGRGIRDIFSKDGEKAFRSLEALYLRKLLVSVDGDLVLSLGGGTVMYGESADLLEKHCIRVYLRAGVGQLVTNLEITGIEDRPLLDGKGTLEDKVAGLLTERSDIYEHNADITVDIDTLSPSEIASVVHGLIFEAAVGTYPDKNL